MRPKGAKGELQVGLKPQVCPPQPTLAKKPKLVQGPKAHRLEIALKTQAMASGNYQRPPATFKRDFPLNIRETLGPAQWTQVCRNQEWCIYGIIYHYASFFLRNSMLMASGLHYAISNQVPKPITHFKGRLQPLSLTVHGGYQKTIWGSQLPGFPGVVSFIPTVFPQENTGPVFFKGNLKRLLIILISCQGINHSSTP
ncbi:hypothetical protein O181_044948 [Austropuccinia psidii MF-1]|uniref:Uncharacterized protein n=1 Tax=Austropuccinia psidii MF-1 TaxID=1389203 RepID=A0A9Q3DPB0_9BASI|nr:hypothetical protein [Austropuccinia psidii MF-1]